MDYEGVGNFSDFIFQDDTTSVRPWWAITVQIIFWIACVCGVVADAFIIFIMFRFKKMQTVPNILLSNWAIANLGTLIITPISYQMLYSDWFLFTALCISFEVIASLNLATLWFAIIVALDWLLAAYFERASEKVRRYYRFVVGGTWAVALLFVSVTGSTCLSDDMLFVGTYVLFLSYCAVLLLVVGIHTFRIVQKCRSKFVDYPALMLILVTAFALSWFLDFVGIFLSFSGAHHRALDIIEEWNILTNSIVSFLLLYTLNTEFQACFLQIIRRSRYEECNFSNPVFNSPSSPNGTANTDVEVSKSQDVFVI